ncbi:MAG TPA: molecular chaperone HtpG [Oscillospiraceae bacterium]|nr:molecular chaperone HtpG [Oscillospiraceae bacterium]
MAKKQFKTESKRMLDLMINSVYTNKDIFLRELISNASDAMDKLYFLSLTNEEIEVSKSELKIELSIDKEKRVLTISDNGVGMTKKELDDHLGIIAKSGSGEFEKLNDIENKDIDIIGQFGVGFYSAFMIAKKVEVVSRAYNSDEAYKWSSEGVDGYTLSSGKREQTGTTITLTVKDNDEQNSYDEYLEEHKIISLIKQYSDYIRYPITMDRVKSRLKEGTKDEYEEYTENETLNSMVPLWKRSKSDIKVEEYNSFYNEKFFDYEKPLKVIHQKAEGTTSYYALMFIPSKADYNYYTKNYEKGLELYSSGVKIMDKCADLLPDYFNFVKGVVDSEDLSLNISRELLQQDRQLKIIANAIERRIKKELSEMLEKEREDYEKFWKSFGLQLKFAIYNSFGTNKDQLLELLMFNKASDGSLSTLKEYTSACPDEQKYIYYAAGDSTDRLSLLPQTELVRDKGYDILFLTDEVDEFLMNILNEYDGKEFRSISSGDLGLETDEEKTEKEEKQKDLKEMFDFIKDSLKENVTKVTLSSRLKSHPVCLSSEGALSIEMEKTLAAMPGAEKELKAEKVLELNDSHPVFEKLTKLWESGDKEKVELYSRLLYSQALIIEGLSVEDPVKFSNEICELMID